ncbi:MAG: Flp/Fap pilin component [Xanthobacteraceae bacterium]|jgi:pilus assembly protein Flp/PilA|nr:Flp/Fap pilin component [Xanthobacteraceae bacterium]
MYTLSTLCSQISRLGADQRGATAIEYAMIAAGVGGSIAATVYGLGSALQTNFYDKLTTLF